MNADELFALHVAAGFSQYRGNLQFVEQVLKAGEMPDAADPVVASYVEQLKRHLSRQCIRENDGFLLRFALVAPGAYRGIHPPLAVLSPERGGFSEKRLEEASRQLGRLREALGLGYHCFPDLSRETATALRELSTRASNPAVSDEKWVGWHGGLSPTEAEKLTDRAFRCLDSALENVREVGNSVLEALAALRPDGLGGTTARLLECEVFWPSSLYRGAPDAVAEMLIQQIDTADGILLNHLLLALAWTRGEVAHDAFLQWRTIPPPWTSELHVPVEDYLHGAGWALEQDGSRRELISLSCHQIVKVPQLSEERLVVPCRVPAGAHCPACGSALSWLFDFAALPPRFFAADRAGAPRKLLCCLNCACFSPVFSWYSPDGTARRHLDTVSSETAPAPTPPSCWCQLSLAPFPPFAAAQPFEFRDASTLGGFPMWLQDFEYPRCPGCTRVMNFLAQFDNLAMPTPEEGLYYGFFCPPCQIAAVSYQQT